MSLILDDVLDESSQETFLQSTRQILVDGPEHVSLPVCAVKMERDSLPVSARAHGCKASRELVDVEHLNANRGAPQISVVAAED